MRDDTARLRKILVRIDERLVRLPASAERARLVELADAIRRYLADRPVAARWDPSPGGSGESVDAPRATVAPQSVSDSSGPQPPSGGRNPF